MFKWIGKLLSPKKEEKSYEDLVKEGDKYLDSGDYEKAQLR